MSDVMTRSEPFLPVNDAISQVAEALTRRVRLLTSTQIADTWFNGDIRMAGSALSQLRRYAMVDTQHVLARPLPTLLAPIVTWNYGDASPDFGKAAYRIKNRWTQPVTTTEIAIATREARKRLGGYCGGRWPRSSEVSHDIGLAGVYLWYRTNASELADHWVSEAQILAEGLVRGDALPDAVIRHTDRSRCRVVEFGGSYGKQKLVAFHEKMQATSYEIW